MFGSLFGKKKKAHFCCKVSVSRPVLDIILAQGILNNEWLVITFFNSTRNQLLKKLNGGLYDGHIISAENIISGSAIPKIKTFLLQGGRTIVLGERHPLRSHENQVAEKLEPSGITFPIAAYSSLDDALLQHFGGERVKELMVRMGMKEDEMIEHSMIERSIENAQDKIAKKVIVESKSNSAEEWFRLNMSLGI